jgi:hypothetical protein
MTKIIYTNKIDNHVSPLPDINKITASDVNEIKESVNSLYDLKGGWADYADASTLVAPINLTQNVWTDLTNDKAGAGTITTYKPLYVSGDLWNSANNSVDFLEIGVGKVLMIRNDFDVTAGASNTRLDARLYFPDSGKSIEFKHDNIAINGVLVRYSSTTQIFTKQSELASGCKIQIKVNKTGCTATVENILITVLSLF